MVKNLNHILPKPITAGDLSIKKDVKPDEKVFNDLLKNEIDKSPVDSDVGLSFSKHALKRLKDRNIILDLKRIQQIEGAIDRVAKKGSNESLIISNDAAFIVNVPKRKVITAMDKMQMQENVFTNIDSTVIA